MEQIAHDFLNSGKTEAEFFNLPKENLIDLKEYLLQMKAKDKEFMVLINEPFISMKEKCPWIGDVAFKFLQNELPEKSSSSVWLFPINGERLIAMRDRENGYYGDITIHSSSPLHLLLSKNTRIHIKRKEELASIQKELRVIDEIGRSYYDGLLYPQKSISGYFAVSYIPNMGMSIWASNYIDLIATFLSKEIKIYNKPYFSEEEKDKVLTKIQINN